MGRLLARFFSRRGFRVAIADPRGALPGFPSAGLDAARDADVVLVSVSLEGTADAVRDVLARDPRGLVCDVASVKAPVVPLLTRAARKGLRVASLHPMFGPSVRTLKGHDLIVCDAGNAAAAEEARRLFDGAGLLVRTIPLAEHDPWVARTLGLAHLLALVAGSALGASHVDLTALDGLASTSFRNLLALARPILEQEPDLTLPIQRLNPGTKATLDVLSREIDSWREALLGSDPAAFERKLRGARRALARHRAGSS